MTISSLDDSQPAGTIGQAQDITGSSDGGILRSASAAQQRSLLGPGEGHTHSRSTSLGGLLPARTQSPQGSLQPSPTASPKPQGTPHAPPPQPTPGSGDKVLPEPPSGAEEGAAPAQEAPPPKPKPVFLKPHIVSPTPEEFLLVTGTGTTEPGIGMFVNLDGDPTRPTIEFERYPREVIVDGGSSDLSSSRANLHDDEEGYVLASMTKEFKDGLHHGIEIQRWDDQAGPEIGKSWLETDSSEGQDPATLGLRSLMDEEETHFQEIVDRLCQKRFSPFDFNDMDKSTLTLNRADSRTALSLERVSKEKELFDRDNDTQSEDSLPDGWEASRNNEEEMFASRFAKIHARVAVWAGSHIWWAIRNPLLLRLESLLDATHAHGEEFNPSTLDRRGIFKTLNSIRGRDARSELEFVTFSYIRQRAGILLLSNFLHPGNAPFSESEIKALEEVLLESTLDARVVLSLIPGLRNEIVESRKGIWIYGGVKRSTEQYMRSTAFQDANQALGDLAPQSVATSDLQSRILLI